MVIVEGVIVIVIEDIVVTLIVSLNFREVRTRGRVIVSIVESTEALDHPGTIFIHLML